MTRPEQLQGAVGTVAAQDISVASRPAWLTAAIPLLLFTGAFALLWPTTASLIEFWDDKVKSTYTHGYLIALVCLWLLWRDRKAIGSSIDPAAPRFAILGLLAASSIVWLIALRAGMQAVHQLLLPPLFLLSVWVALGWRVMLRCALPAAYMYFAIPVWELFNRPLQWMTALVTDQLLRLSGVPAFVDGNIVHLAAGTFEIAGGCSGVHYLIVASALGVLYGEIHRDSLFTRFKLLVIAVGLALVANWVRVYGVILAGYLTNMQSYLVRVSHSEFGWVIFAVAMTVYFLIAVRMATTPATATPDAPRRGPVSMPAKANALLLGAGLALSAMAIGPVWNVVVPLDPARLPAAGMLLPSDVGAWQGPQNTPDADWQPLFPAADLVQAGKYSNAGKDVEMFVAAYSSQRQGKEIVSYDNSVVGKDAATLSTQNLPGPTKEVAAVAHSGHEFVVRYFYQIGSLRTADDLQEQLHYATESLHGNPLSIAVAISAACVPDCDAARATLDAFAAQVAKIEPQSQDHEGDRQ